MSSVADELAVQALPEETLELLRRVAAEGSLYQQLGMGEPECPNCEELGFMAQFCDCPSEDDVIAAYRAGWKTARNADESAPETVEFLDARDACRAADLL